MAGVDRASDHSTTHHTGKTSAAGLLIGRDGEAPEQDGPKKVQADTD